MIKTVQIKSGLTLYDYASILHGGFDNVVKLLKDNDYLGNLDANLSDFATQELTYDEADYVTKAPQLSITAVASSKVNTIQSIKGQSLYDIALMVHGGFDSIVKLLIENDINSINEQALPASSFTFNTDDAVDSAVVNVIGKKGIVFATGGIDYNSRITTAGDYRITTDGSIRITS